MDSKTIIYIVLGIGWYLFKNYRKNQKSKQQPQQTSYENYEEEEVIEQNQPDSFKDLFEGLLAPKPQPEKEIRIEEPIKFNNPEAFVDKRSQKKKKEKEELKSERFDEYKIETKEQKDYSEMFETPQSVEEAFVASEIFTRKF